MRVAFLMFMFLGIGLAVGHNSMAYAQGQIKIYTVTPQKVAEYVNRKQGARRVMMVYTSWCPYCHQKMPDLMKIERAKKGSVIAVSVDESYEAYAKYAKKNLADAPFPLFFNKGSEDYLARVLNRNGVQPWNGYPTLIFLDENNQAVGQGNYSTEQVVRFLSGE